jgi:hypothetical protein
MAGLGSEAINGHQTFGVPQGVLEEWLGGAFGWRAGAWIAGVIGIGERAGLPLGGGFNMQRITAPASAATM